MATRDGEGQIRRWIRCRPQDFKVVELPLEDAPRASEQGAHLWLEIEKTDYTTEQAVREVCVALGVERKQAGFAGRKDRHAVTRQWISVPWSKASSTERLAELGFENLHILRWHRSDRRLALGELAGNRFEIAVRRAPDEVLDADRLERIEGFLRTSAERLSSRGMCNGFGPQRFGRRRDNAPRGRQILSAAANSGAERPDFALQRLLVSAYQSELFERYVEKRNQWFAEQARPGCEGDPLDAASRLLSGDVLYEHRTGFLARLELGAERAGSEASESVENLQWSPTGPLYGPSMWLARNTAGRLEKDLLAEEGLDLESALVRRNFERLRLRGTRRPLRVPVKDLRMESEAVDDPAGTRRSVGCESARQDLPPVDRVLRFTLPAGSYATVLLEQLYGSGVIEDRALEDD